MEDAVFSIVVVDKKPYTHQQPTGKEARCVLCSALTVGCRLVVHAASNSLLCLSRLTLYRCSAKSDTRKRKIHRQIGLICVRIHEDCPCPKRKCERHGNEKNAPPAFQKGRLPYFKRPKTSLLVFLKRHYKAELLNLCLSSTLVVRLVKSD